MNTTFQGAAMPAHPVSFRLDEVVKTRLERAAKDEDRSLSYLAQKAITSYLDAKDYKHQVITEAYNASLIEKEFISGEAMSAWVDSWGTDNELPEPTPDIFRD